MRELKPYDFPNMGPTVQAVLALGFVQIDDPYEFIFEREGIPGRLAVFHETASWDISDCTWLEYSPTGKFKKDQWQSLSLADAEGKHFYMGIQHAPTPEMIKQAIIRTVEWRRQSAKDSLLEAVKKLEDADAHYKNAKINLDW